MDRSIVGRGNPESISVTAEEASDLVIEALLVRG
jgi:hypothetical protein